MDDFEQKVAIIAQSLRESVAKALEKKRLLGQCAVIWENDQVVFIHPSKPKTKTPTA